MITITVTAISFSGKALYNIESTESQGKRFSKFSLVGGFTKGRNFTSNDNVESVKNKIDNLIKVSQRFIELNKKGFDNLDILILLYLQALIEGKIGCPRCKNKLYPGEVQCETCGWKNILLADGFI